MAPTPSIPPPCPPPGGQPGPLKTIRAALVKIAQDPVIYSNPPFTVRIAGRFHEVSSSPYIYGDAPAGQANYSGEQFLAPGNGSLKVPPRTLLLADASHTESDPDSDVPIPVIIEGPALSSGIDTIEFRAEGAPEDYFTSEGGLDGSEIPPYGIEVRGGQIGVSLLVDGSPGTPQWPQIPPFDPTLLVPGVSIRIDHVSFTGRGAAFDLDAHVLRSGFGNFTVSNCRFSTDTGVPAISLPQPPPPLPPQHSGQALVHLWSTSLTATVPNLDPTFTSNLMTVDPAGGPGGPLPDVPYGLLVEPFPGSNSFVRVSGLTVDGQASPTSPQGIVAGLELASNTGNPFAGATRLIPRFDLVGSTIMNCAAFGAAIATGAAPSVTVTRLEIANNAFIGNGVRPDGTIPSSPSTHCHYPGSGMHLVCRTPGSWFIGSITKNGFTGNVTGMALSTGSTIPAFPLPPGPKGLTIARNDASGQVLAPPVPPTFLCPIAGIDGDGVGMILGDDSAIGVGGLLNKDYVIEENRVSGNARHGIWVRVNQSQSSFFPVFRNNRVWGNGTVAPADGVRLFLNPAATASSLTATLVNETVVLHMNGYGVNNVAGVGAPVLWNSIVYDNTGPVVAPPTFPNGGPDLFGFVFPTGPPGTPGTVNFSDFCGGPWDPAMFSCGTVTTPPVGTTHECISSPPNFVAPLSVPPNFELLCSGAGAPPSCGCSPPPPTGMGSACIDAGSNAGAYLPPTDAKGTRRVVDLYPEVTPPDGNDVDMGALEKQTCIP